MNLKTKIQIYQKLINELGSRFEGAEEFIQNKNTDHPNDAVNLVKKIDKLIKCSKNNILTLAYQQGKVFQKFKKNNKFVNAVTEFEKSNTTVNFKTDIVNFIDKYPKMRKSSISLFYLKNNFRIIKNVCQEHASEFQ